MPKFYLDLKGGGQVAKDDFGIEVDSLGDARKAAEALLGNKAKQAPRRSIPFSRSLLWTRMVKKC